MTSFSRQLRRRKRNNFMKTFKKTMKTFKESVKCSECLRPPHEGESIDKWILKRYPDRIVLVCTDCTEPNEEEETNE